MTSANNFQPTYNHLVNRNCTDHNVLYNVQILYSMFIHIIQCMLVHTNIFKAVIIAKKFNVWVITVYMYTYIFLITHNFK